MKVNEVCSCLVSSGVIPRNWADELDSLEQEKLFLVGEGANEIKDDSAKDYIQSIQIPIIYADCVKVVKLLIAGEDGKSKTFFTRKFTSGILNRWITFVEKYNARNLFIAETARELRRNSNEIGALKRRVVEVGSKLSDLDGRKAANAININNMQSRLDSLVGMYNIEDISIQDIQIRSKIGERAKELLSDLDARFNSPIFQGLLTSYASKFPSSQPNSESASVHIKLLLAEELTSYLHIADPPSEHIAEEVRKLANAAISFNLGAEVAKISDEISRLRTACIQNKEGRRLADLEDQFRDEIRKCESQIEEIRDREKELVKRLNAELVSVNRQPLEIAID